MLLLLLLISCFVSRRLSVDFRINDGIVGVFSFTWNVRSLLSPFKIIVRSGFGCWFIVVTLLIEVDGCNGTLVCFEVNNFAVGLLREFFWKLATKAFFQFWLLLLVVEDAPTVKNGGVLGTCSPVANVWLVIAESSRTPPARVNILVIDELPGVFGARWKETFFFSDDRKIND